VFFTIVSLKKSAGRLPIMAGEFKYIPIYVFGPLAGGALAAGMFYLCNIQTEFKKKDPDYESVDGDEKA
jgi:hypothetical protein